MLGALVRHVTSADPRHFQPMKANLGLLPALPAPAPRARKERARLLSRRSAEELERYLLSEEGTSIAHSHD
jgi:methylenetetrahydrofolate--tRNA-(uracil-5-)-methyltransferase